MAIITMPAGLLVERATFGVARFDVGELSAESGNSADRLLGPPRWTLSLQSPVLSQRQMDLWRTMLVQLRGRVNHLAAWDPGRPAPLGTMRGTMTLNGSVSQGATTCSITASGQGSNTLLAGDWLQISTGITGQLIMVMADATASGGVISVTFEPPIRKVGGYAGGTAVTWDKALGHYKMVNEAARWSVEPGLLESGASIDLIEQW